MTATSDRRRTLSDEDLRTLMGLLKGSDSVELKLSVPDSGHRKALMALGLDALNAQVRVVYFLDTPDLLMSSTGLLVRARRIQGKTGDTTVKLRPVDPAELSAGLRRITGFSVEVDAMPGGYVCSASMRAPADNDRILTATKGSLPMRKLFTREQRAFFREHAPGGIGLDELTFLGPVFVLKAKWVPHGALRPMVAEMWFFPDGSRTLELSRKCLPDEAFQVAAESRAYLSGLGIDLSGEQQTKTRRALEQLAETTVAA